MKIDVQGYEHRMFLGGEQVVHQASFMLIETAFDRLYKGEANFSGVYDIMTRYGFRYAGNLDQLTNPSSGLPLYADALFVRE